MRAPYRYRRDRYRRDMKYYMYIGMDEIETYRLCPYVHPYIVNELRYCTHQNILHTNISLNLLNNY